MLKIGIKLLLILSCFTSQAYAEELQVHLSTRAPLPPLYISQVKTDPEQYDWRYFDELRSVLIFDLNISGHCTLVDPKPEWENRFQWPDVKRNIDLTPWERQKIPFIVVPEMFEGKFCLVAFNVQKKTSKRYSGFDLTGKLEVDRKEIHRLADALQRDLFGTQGVSSLRLIYTQRTRNPDPKGADWLSEVWVCDSDGANSAQITNEGSYCVSPGFLPGKAWGSDFFYVSYQGGQSKIYRSSLKEPKAEPFVSLRGSQLLPAISAKGSQIAFIADAAGRPDLFIQNVDPSGKMIGKARQLFSAPRATQASPTFSPDGRQIAFVSDKDGPPRIYMMDVTTPKDTKRHIPHLLTKKNRENTSPTWSPDGKKLAYSAKTEGIRQIWIYDFETDEEKQLTSGPENKENPSWAPDNLHLVYNTESDDICELFLINLTQREPVLIAKGSGQKRFPSWERR